MRLASMLVVAVPASAARRRSSTATLATFIGDGGGDAKLRFARGETFLTGF